MDRRVVFANSGGLDSWVTAVVLYNMGFQLYSVHLDMGQPNEKRAIESVKALAERFCILGSEIITIRTDKRTSLTHSHELKGRNGVPNIVADCSVIASTIAKLFIPPITKVATGQKSDTGHDQSWASAFCTIVNGGLRLCDIIPVRPLIWYRTLRDTYERGLQEGLSIEDMNLSVSCSFEAPCGTCDKCRDRIEVGLKAN